MICFLCCVLKTLFELKQKFFSHMLEMLFLTAVFIQDLFRAHGLVSYIPFTIALINNRTKKIYYLRYENVAKLKRSVLDK